MNLCIVDLKDIFSVHACGPYILKVTSQFIYSFASGRIRSVLSVKEETDHYTYINLGLAGACNTHPQFSRSRRKGFRRIFSLAICLEQIMWNVWDMLSQMIACGVIVTTLGFSDWRKYIASNALLPLPLIFIDACNDLYYCNAKSKFW